MTAKNVQLIWDELRSRENWESAVMLTKERGETQQTRYQPTEDHCNPGTLLSGDLFIPAITEHVDCN